MSVARHPRPKELEGVPLEEIMKRYVGRFKDKKPDWSAFADAKIDGYLKQLGPYFETAWNTGESVDENSADRKAFGAALDELASKCSS